MLLIPAYIKQLFHTYGPWAISVGFMLEGMGAPVPMELLYGLLGSLIGQGELSYAAGVGIAFSGAVTGNFLGYMLGHFGGRSVADYLCNLLRLNPKRIEALEAKFRNNSMATIFVVRWIGWGFAQVMWLSGMTRIALPKFLAVTMLSNLLWACFWTYVGYHGVAFIGRIYTAGGLALVLLGFVVLGLLAFHWIGGRKWYTRKLPGSSKPEE